MQTPGTMWTPAQLQQVREWRRQGKTWQEIADLLGVRRERVRAAFRRAVQSGRLDWIEPASQSQQPRDRVEAERERARRRQEAEELRRLVERAAVIRELREAIREAALAAEPPKLMVKPPIVPDEDRETPVLLLGDVHVGQATPARLTGGYPYSVEVTERQFRALAEYVLRAMDQYGRRAGWREILILDLGDDVENDDLHTTQHRLVDPVVVRQVQIYGRLLAELVLSLLTAFEAVRVERVPGNHGRTTKKPGYAGLAELDPADSYDWLAGEFAAAFLRDAKRAEVVNHETFYAVTEVAGQRIVFEHGSSLRGGASWGGIPYYGIDRTAAAYRELVGEYLVLALGHYHRPYMLPTGYGGWAIGNGSFAPTTPFVLASKHRVVRPSQTLMSIHPRHGVTAVWRIPLDQPWAGGQAQGGGYHGSDLVGHSGGGASAGDRGGAEAGRAG